MSEPSESQQQQQQKPQSTEARQQEEAITNKVSAYLVVTIFAE
jgi:hypothetical protein